MKFLLSLAARFVPKGTKPRYGFSETMMLFLKGEKGNE